MKIIKISLVLFGFLLTTQLTFAADVCPGETATLNYSSSNVPVGETCNNLQVPQYFSVPATTAVPNTSDSWSIPVPSNANAGVNKFTLVCGGTAQSTDSLNVLSPSLCCDRGVNKNSGKVWNETACVVPACGNGLAASYQPTCTCPSGQSIVGSACQLTCTAPQVLNAAQTACVLPTPTCVLPQVLNAAGDTCILPTPNGTISANPNPCTIAYNQSNCASGITWSSQYTSSPNVWLDSTTTFSNIPSGTQPFPFVAHGGNLFQLRDGTTVLNSTTVSGVCVASTEWVGGRNQRGQVRVFPQLLHNVQFKQSPT